MSAKQDLHQLCRNPWEEGHSASELLHFVASNGASATNNFTHAEPPVAFNQEENADAQIFEFQIIPVNELGLQMV